MSNDRSTGRIMRAGIIAAAVIVVLRVILEQSGAPERVSFIFGVAWLYFLLPICFALRIASAQEATPFKGLLKDVLIFGIYSRLMVMATYMIAYLRRWNVPRFALKQGGNVGENVSFLMGFLVIPVRNAIIWVVIVTAVGMIIGGITLAIARKSSSAATS